MEGLIKSSEGGDEQGDYVEDSSEGVALITKRFKKSSSARSRFTLSAASKMLRKKIPQSGLLMVPKRLWMQTVTTQDCDVVVLFSPTSGEATINWLVSAMKGRVSELVVAVKSHMAVGCFALYVTATMDGLVRGGEELKISKMTKIEYGSGLRELSQAELAIFQGVEEPSTFFTSQERQSIILHLLNSLRAAEGDEVAGIQFRPGQAIIPKCQTEGVITQIVPLHDHNKLAHLRVTWVQSFFRYQPLDDIQEYFGSKIGIYFSWLGFYTASLTVPAVIGLVFWINFWGKDQAKEDKAFLVLAFLNVIWGSMWLEAWKRRSAELTHKWGTQDSPHELLEDPRPHFRGDLEISPVTGRLEPVYPSWRRNIFRYFITLPVVVLCLALVFMVMFIILQIQDWWDEVIDYRGLPSFFSYGPKFIMALTISVFDEGYYKIAMWLNDQENYRSEESYHNHLIIKLAAFRLVNSFLVLFYIAFYLQDMEILKAQLAALFLTRQIVGNIKESCIPYFLEQMKLAKLSFELFGAITPSEGTSAGVETENKDPETIKKSDDVNDINKKIDGTADNATLLSSPSPKVSSKNRIISNAEIECNMSKYDDTFEDYLEMFIQFGYVMLFSSAFPLAAVCAFVNNLIEIRSDAFKLCCVFQRPFGQKARSIGVWQDAMEFMCLLGIMVNCMLIGLSGQVHRMFPDMSTTQTILLIIVLEHAMIALKYGISYAIPDIPHKIAQQLAIAEFRRREAFRKLSLSNSPPNQEESGQSTPKSCPLSNLSSMEYIERSVQTETVNPITTTNSIRKSSHESRASKDILSNIRKGSADSRFENESKPIIPSINLGRSVSAGDKVKHAIPKVSKRWNQTFQDHSHSQFVIPPFKGGSGPTPSESLPLLSAPANFDHKANSFNFSAKPENISLATDQKVSPEPEITSSKSKSSESMTASTIKEESIASNTLTETDSFLEDREDEDKFSKYLPERKAFPSAEYLPVATPTENSGESTEDKVETPKMSKKHPAKFLKRAQSFSQVFKKMADKRKKSGETLRDDYRCAIMEPLGELALVPLEKLVSIEDLQHSRISEEP